MVQTKYTLIAPGLRPSAESYGGLSPPCLAPWGRTQGDEELFYRVAGALAPAAFGGSTQRHEPLRNIENIRAIKITIPRAERFHRG
jgi:hypothetical protein